MQVATTIWIWLFNFLCIGLTDSFCHIHYSKGLIYNCCVEHLSADIHIVLEVLEVLFRLFIRLFIS